jgi:hypothetical protein
MYVDSIAMMKWLDSNPSIFTEQYRSLYPRIGVAVSVDGTASDLDRSRPIIQVNDHEYLISQIAKDAFEQFCMNAEFGIESYLSRRIRHNTLDGVTMDTIDAVLRKPEYAAQMSSPSTRRVVEPWMTTYKAIVDKLRRDYLQFKSPDLPPATVPMILPRIRLQG